ncbi:MAG: beta-ketoacyl-[acyl-carrier-protein] synthase family protein [Bacteroidales bacterium]|nr:beta-ketoacyl-[acyl-carrier-protein] synthase family protein [Bacteroidales bacterium]
MTNKVFVTGIGIISSIGDNVEETLKSILEEKSGIGPIKYLKTIHNKDFVVGEVKHSNEELIEIAGLSSSCNKVYTRTALLGIIAACEAVKSAGIKDIQFVSTGLISATTVGGIDKSEHYFYDFLNSKNLEYAKTHHCGDSTDKIADTLNIKGFTTTISTACSSSANAIMLGARLIKNKILDRVIVGGTDSLSKYTLNGFNTLMILDKELCKPFDENRKGLNLGEGAGFIILESEKSVKKDNKRILCEVKGYANTNDAYHQTASSPEGFGAYLSMKKALDKNGLIPADIDYINVHGTGTDNNDISEGKALKKLFGENIPEFSSTKSFTGHTLGAAGGIEAVISVLSITKGFIPPNLNFSNTISELGITPQSELIKNINIKTVLSNSFGFGGNNSSLIFSEP